MLTDVPQTNIMNILEHLQRANKMRMSPCVISYHADWGYIYTSMEVFRDNGI